MSIQVKNVEYREGTDSFVGYAACDEAVSGPRPGVLIAHAWSGRSDFEDRKAELLAELGYVALAIDVYGRGKRGASPDENRALMSPLLEDRAKLLRRLTAGYEQLRNLPNVDAERTAAIGFCFGGLCVLDLLRAGVELRGVVSFHGLLTRPDSDLASRNHPRPAALLLHGWKDPLATPDQVLGFAREMEELGADWQLNAFGNAVHAFTNPAADDAADGKLYDAVADRRSWDAMQLFLNEIFV